MDRFGIAKGYRITGPINVQDAVTRAQELMTYRRSQLPYSAVDYARYLGQKYGMSGEVAMTAFAHYAQEVEGMATDEDLYKTNAEARDFFKTWM